MLVVGGRGGIHYECTQCTHTYKLYKLLQACFVIPTALQYMEQVLQGDLWIVAQHQPQLFSKGGAYYQQVSDQLGGQIKNNTHIQFQEFREKVFAYNLEKERLELCLGECTIYSKGWMLKRR